MNSVYDIHELHSWYLDFNQYFLKANPEASNQFPEMPFEKFEMYWIALNSYPDVQKQLIDQWKRGYSQVMKKVVKEIEQLTLNCLSGKITTQQYKDGMEKIWMEAWGPEIARREAMENLRRNN